MARVTLTARWFGLMKWVDTIDNEFLTKFFTGQRLPELVHEFVPWKGTESYEIAVIRLHHEGIPRIKGKRPTLKLYEKLNEWVRQYDPRDADIIIECKNFPHSRTFRMYEILQDERLSFDIFRLGIAIEAFRSVYGPKPDHVACRYCRKQTPAKTALFATFPLTSTSGTFSKHYCSPICKTHDEWAHQSE